MDKNTTYASLFEKRSQYLKYRNSLPTPSVESYGLAFDIQYAHDSTAMEGNTLSLIETKLLLEDQISIGGKKLREIYEVINHNKAYYYVKECIAKGELLDEKIVKDIHALLMYNIMQGGIYRSVDVYISGAEHTPPSPNTMYQQIKNFYSDLAWKGNDLNDIQLAAWTHAEFVKIYPYVDGNGRTSRLIMNYMLLSNAFLPISIPTEMRLQYYNALEIYATKDDLTPFTEMIAELEDQQLNRYLDLIQYIDQEPIEPTMTQ